MINLLKASALAATTMMSLATILPTTASAYTFPKGVGQSHCCHDNRGGGHDGGGHGFHGDFHRWGREWGYRGFYGYGYGYPTSYSGGDSCPIGYFLNYWGHCRPRPFPIRPF